MGLLYTKHYVDFDESDWKPVVTNPPEFEALTDGVTLEISDASYKQYKLKFKKGGRIKSFRVVGRFRLTWDDDALLEKL